MAIDVSNVDLENVEDVTDITPRPDLIVGDNEHHFGALGHVGKRLLLELLKETDESVPAEDRVFGRLGLDVEKARWNGYELFWVHGGADAFTTALEEWNSARNL